VNGKRAVYRHDTADLGPIAAEEDQLFAPEAQAAIEQAAAPHSDLVRVMGYPGVGHAFARRGGPVFDQQSSERVDKATKELFLASLVDAA
jgi:dienelactone hydrolase